MSKCHSCVHADWNESSLWCEDCNSGDRFLSRSVPITVQQPVYLGHRDEGWDTTDDDDDLEYTDLMSAWRLCPPTWRPSGFEWECNECGHNHSMTSAPDEDITVMCQGRGCGARFKIGGFSANHVY